VTAELPGASGEPRHVSPVTIGPVVDRRKPGEALVVTPVSIPDVPSDSLDLPAHDAVRILRAHDYKIANLRRNLGGWVAYQDVEKARHEATTAHLAKMIATDEVHLADLLDVRPELERAADAQRHAEELAERRARLGALTEHDRAEADRKAAIRRERAAIAALETERKTK
jgi:hypothetical protein